MVPGYHILHIYIMYTIDIWYLIIYHYNNRCIGIVIWTTIGIIGMCNNIYIYTELWALCTDTYIICVTKSVHISNIVLIDMLKDVYRCAMVNYMDKQ